ncbi:hypothetical protein LTR85_007769 [Meristemomyces frigidus]|nr:hypothetical protein LTR85_007769 [Meristemomyces frigidus]
MAPSLESQETAETIDVSRNAETPADSSPPARGPVVAETYEERIEDSYKDTTMPTTTAADRPSPTEDDDDEMYALSPKGKAALEVVKASAKKPAAQGEPRDTQQECSIRDADVPAIAKAAVPAGAPRGVIDDLLSQGATARPAQIEKHCSKTKSREEPDEGVCADLGSLSSLTYSPAVSRTHRTVDSKPTGRVSAKPSDKLAESARHATPHRGQSGPNQQATASSTASKSAAVSASTSALAALRAKRQGPTQTEFSKPASATPAPIKRSKPTQTLAAVRPPLKERSKNLQTPARTDPKAQPTEQRPTTGKLKSRRMGMLAETPVSRPAVAERPKRKREAEQETVEEQSEVEGDERSIKTASEKRPSAPGALKRPGKSLKASNSAARKPTYDVPESPAKVDSARPPKRSRVAAKSAPKPHGASTGTTSKPTKRSQDSAPPKAVLKQSSKGKQKAVVENDDQEPSSEAPTRKQPSRRAKIPVDTTGKQLQTEIEASSDRILNPHGTADKQNQAPRKDDRNGQESIEDFEQAVVGFAGEETAISPTDLVTSTKRVHIKAEPAITALNDSTISSDPTRGPRRGASQEQAIVLSDRQESSSPVRSSSVHPSTAPPAVTTSAHRKPRKAKAPQTPPVLGSSPPIAHQGPALPLTAGLLDANTSRKSTIISFDRSGPRNQGSASARKSARGSAWTNRTSLPPRRVPLASEAGDSRARLDALPRKGPSSIATSMRSTRTNRAAPPSNVAHNVGDALAGFFKKPSQGDQTPAKALPTQHAGRQEAANSLEHQRTRIADDDGFTNVDDYEGTTFVDDEPAKISPPTLKPSAAPSASQQAMPPPAPKAHKTSTVHRAPTVPSMLGLEGDLQSDAVGGKTAEKPRSKRVAPAAEQEAAPAAKRQKTAAAPRPHRAQSPATTAAAIVTVRPAASQAGFRAAKRPMPDATKRGVRKPSRHASQGNVDIHGSPIPKGLIVLDNATALESFSQQVGLSSDQMLAEVATAANRRRVGEQQNDSSAFDEHILPPSHQPEILSSNTKLRPASPEDESQAITGIVTGRVDPKQLVIRDAAAPPATDPFTSCEDARKEPAKGSTSFIFAEQLRLHAAQAANVRRQAESEDADRTLVERDVSNKKKPKRIASISSDDSSESSASSDETSTTVRDIGIWRGALQPYQMNLFDELVNVSHRLVQHLIDRETATRDVVDDYRRRGLNLIEDMERAHAQQYQRYMVDLKQKKKRLRKDLNKCSEQLKDAVTAVEEAKVKRKEEAGKRKDEEQELQELMAQYC